jgi:hypothetical protein
MSLYYKHFLIPLAPTYRPKPDAIAKFGQGIIENGNVAVGFTISFSRITRGLRAITARNPATGKTMSIRGPTRRPEKAEALAGTSQIIESGLGQPEYDVSISAEGIPANPPLTIGSIEKDTWEPWVNAYHLEIRCRVRSNIVRLFHLENEEDLNAPADLAKYRPRFDEDCSVAERDGLFALPEAGAIRIPNAGCGTFWIEFNYGKFLFPLLRDNQVNVLNDSTVAIAREAFGCDFVQACDWG